MFMRTGRIIGAALFIGLLACPPSMGQDAEPGGAQGAAYRRIAEFCVADAARFCPMVDQAPSVPRDQVMCLKIYRADLSLSCRHAVTAVLAATHPMP